MSEGKWKSTASDVRNNFTSPRGLDFIESVAILAEDGVEVARVKRRGECGQEIESFDALEQRAELIVRAVNERDGLLAELEARKIENETLCKMAGDLSAALDETEAT